MRAALPDDDGSDHQHGTDGSRSCLRSLASSSEADAGLRVVQEEEKGKRLAEGGQSASEEYTSEALLLRCSTRSRLKGREGAFERFSSSFPKFDHSSQGQVALLRSPSRHEHPISLMTFLHSYRTSYHTSFDRIRTCLPSSRLHSPSSFPLAHFRQIESHFSSVLRVDRRYPRRIAEKLRSFSCFAKIPSPSHVVFEKIISTLMGKEPIAEGPKKQLKGIVADFEGNNVDKWEYKGEAADRARFRIIIELLCYARNSTSPGVTPSIKTDLQSLGGTWVRDFPCSQAADHPFSNLLI